jgi:hypothetical protein
MDQGAAFSKWFGLWSIYEKIPNELLFCISKRFGLRALYVSITAVVQCSAKVIL